MTPFEYGFVALGVLAAVLTVAATWNPSADPADMDEATRVRMREARRAHALVRFKTKLFNHKNR